MQDKKAKICCDHYSMQHRSFVISIKKKFSPSAANIAINPENGKLRHGTSGRQLLVRASAAASNMCTKPVAKMTPAANAFIKTKPGPPPLVLSRILNLRPMSGIPMPTIPDKRIAAMAHSFSSSANNSLRHVSESSDPKQLEAVETNSSTDIY
jgi:hypothetical protein